MIYFLGIRAYDFKDQQTGRQISGVTVWLADDAVDGASGIIPIKTSLSQEDFNRLFSGFDTNTPMQPVKTSFNHSGRLQHISVAK